MKIIADVKIGKEKRTDRIVEIARDALLAGADGIYIDAPGDALIAIKEMCEELYFEYWNEINKDDFYEVNEFGDYKKAHKSDKKGIIDNTKEMVVIPFWEVLIKSMAQDDEKYLTPNEFRDMCRNVKNYQLILNKTK
jgi:hypothetical protein